MLNMYAYFDCKLVIRCILAINFIHIQMISDIVVLKRSQFRWFGHWKSLKYMQFFCVYGCFLCNLNCVFVHEEAPKMMCLWFARICAWWKQRFSIKSSQNIACIRLLMPFDKSTQSKLVTLLSCLINVTVHGDFTKTQLTCIDCSFEWLNGIIDRMPIWPRFTLTPFKSVIEWMREKRLFPTSVCLKSSNS